jgi:patatin-like phospholipase/acyl hydrolase
MRILSVDGGGYLGLASAAFLEEMERHFGVDCHKRFDLFCGTSTGAIIALALASGMSAKEVATLYQNFGAQVFRNYFPGSRQIRFVRGFFFARYSNAPLRKALADAFGEMTIGDLRKKNKSVLVTAFSVTSGRPRVFKTDHSSDLTRDNGYLLRDVALASAAAPVYLPVVKLMAPATGVEERYCDGGVFANHPALLGYAEAVSHLGVNPNTIRILSLSTPRADHAERASAKGAVRQFLLSRGLISWGSKLAGVMIDSTSMIAHETLRRMLAWPPGVNDARYVRIELQKPSGVDMDVANQRATKTLRQIGSEHAYRTEIRNRLSPFFQG